MAAPSRVTARRRRARYVSAWLLAPRVRLQSAQHGHDAQTAVGVICGRQYDWRGQPRRHYEKMNVAAGAADMANAVPDTFKPGIHVRKRTAGNTAACAKPFKHVPCQFDVRWQYSKAWRRARVARIARIRRVHVHDGNFVSSGMGAPLAGSTNVESQRAAQYVQYVTETVRLDAAQIIIDDVVVGQYPVEYSWKAPVRTSADGIFSMCGAGATTLRIIGYAPCPLARARLRTRGFVVVVNNEVAQIRVHGARLQPCGGESAEFTAESRAKPFVVVRHAPSCPTAGVAS